MSLIWEGEMYSILKLLNSKGSAPPVDAKTIILYHSISIL
jgi:hypothetical protein